MVAFFFNIFVVFLKIIIILTPLLISIAYFTLDEKRIMDSDFKFLQPFTKKFNSFIKENIFPRASLENIFLLSGLYCFFLSIVCWSLISVSRASSNEDFFFIYFLFINLFSFATHLYSCWAYVHSRPRFLLCLKLASVNIYWFSKDFVLFLGMLTFREPTLAESFLVIFSIWHYLCFQYKLYSVNPSILYPAKIVEK